MSMYTNASCTRTACEDVTESPLVPKSGGDDRDADGKGKGKGKGKKRVASKAAEAPAQQRSKVVSQFLPTDVSHIRKECDALKDCLVFFVPAPEKTAKYKKGFLEELVARLGGKVISTVHMHHNSSHHDMTCIHACVHVLSLSCLMNRHTVYIVHSRNGMTDTKGGAGDAELCGTCHACDRPSC